MTGDRFTSDELIRSAREAVREMAAALQAAEARATEAEAECDTHVEQTRNWMRAIDGLTAERDAAFAVIEKARNTLGESRLMSDGHVSYAVIDDVEMSRILSSVPADVLRERDAEKWGEGYLAGLRSVTPNAPLGGPNPYRIEEQSND